MPEAYMLQKASPTGLVETQKESQDPRAGLEHFHLYAVDRVTCGHKKSNSATEACDRIQGQDSASLGKRVQTIYLSILIYLSVYLSIDFSICRPCHPAIERVHRSNGLIVLS